MILECSSYIELIATEKIIYRLLSIKTWITIDSNRQKPITSNNLEKYVIQVFPKHDDAIWQATTSHYSIQA